MNLKTNIYENVSWNYQKWDYTESIDQLGETNILTMSISLFPLTLLDTLIVLIALEDFLCDLHTELGH